MIRIILLIAVLSCAVPANAALIDRGHGMIYDTFLDITWLQDADFAKSIGFISCDGTVGRMYSWEVPIGNIPYTSYTDWHLPSIDELIYMYAYNLSSQTNNTYPFYNVETSYPYWSSTVFGSGDDTHGYWYFSFYNGEAQFMGGIGEGGIPIFAWPVRDGDSILPAPEPSTICLLLCGIFIIALCFFRQQSSLR